MNGELMVITLVIAVGILVVLIAKLASFLKSFAEETRYLCYEMEHADSYNEYRKWRGELRCHYLCLIPFVNGKNVMRLYKRIWHRGDHVKKKERGDSLVPLLLPSVLGIFICMVCVCGMTWAWYSASVETPAQKLTAAYYEVTVNSVKDGDGEITVENGAYPLTADKTYTVTLTANGSVRECGGYCLIEGGDTKTYTQTFKPKESITVIFTPSASGTYTFTGVWGSLPAGTENYLSHTEPVAEPVVNNPVPDNTVDPIPSEPTDQPSEPDVTEPAPSEPVSSEHEPPATDPVTEYAAEPETESEPSATEPIDEPSDPGDSSEPIESSSTEE